MNSADIRLQIEETWPKGASKSIKREKINAKRGEVTGAPNQTPASDFKSHTKNDPYSPEKLDPPGIQRTALKELPQHSELNMQL